MTTLARTLKIPTTYRNLHKKTEHNQPESTFWGPVCRGQRSSCLLQSAELSGYRDAEQKRTHI